MDNYAAHKHPKVKAWLAANPRIHVHFTPTSGSWLNLVEVWFGIIERQAIHRGTFASVRDLMIKIRDLHQRLERPLPTLHLDQDSRPDPAESQPSNNFSFGPLADLDSYRLRHGAVTARWVYALVSCRCLAMAVGITLEVVGRGFAHRVDGQCARQLGIRFGK